MFPLFSIVSGVVGGIVKAVRSAGEADAGAKNPSITPADRQAGSAATEATGGSFAQKFRAQMAKATDSNGDGVISRAELAQQLAKGGVGAAAADQQYKAMDKNGDGQVSVEEFKDATPVPTSPLVQQILQMIEARRAAAGTGSSAAGGASSL